MFCVFWHGPGGYDRFIRVDEREMQEIVNHYADPEAAAWGDRDGYHYYLLCDEKRILTPLKRPSLAFSGLWNGYPPYGDETACYFALDKLSEYRLEKDWQAPKE